MFLHEERIGKITTQLAELGWLVKYKKGFSGHNTYQLTFPKALEAEYTSNDDLPLEAENTSSLEAENTSSLEAENTSCNKQTRITNQNNKPVLLVAKAPKTKKFVKPSFDQLLDFKNENQFISDPQSFFDYHESRGWVVGRAPMKDWRAAFRTWERNKIQWEQKQQIKKSESIRDRSIDQNLEDRSWAL